MKKNNELKIGRRYRITDKTSALKWIIIGLGIAIVAVWIGWFVCDCFFVSKGIKIRVDKWIIIEELIEIPWITNWHWDAGWYDICNKLATAALALLGGYIVLQLAYGVICGLNVKKNIKYYVYQLIVTITSFIGITICIIKSAEMMVNEKWMLNITFLPPKFDVYHLDFLKWMSIAFGFTIFTNVLMLRSFQPIDRHIIIRDCNLLVLVLGFASAFMFIPFIFGLGWNDKFIGDVTSIQGWIKLAQDPITWKHIVCQCVTSPMGVLAGMVMVLLVIRLVTVMFVYNKRWGEKKSHIIIFSAITFCMFASFIVAHANKLDFEKLLNKYNDLKLGCLLVVLAQSLSCLAAGIYGLISHVNYERSVNK